MQSKPYHHYTIYCFLFLVSVAAYTVFQQLMMFWDCDSPWHVAAGSLILELGRIPETDPWSFTAGESRWYNISWLYDIAVGWLHDNLGIKGLIGVNILVVSIPPVLLAKLCFQRGSTILATIIAVGFAIIMLKASVTVRPQHITLALLCLILWILYNYRDRISWHIWLIPVITALWANMHGSYLLIFSVIGAFFLEALFNKDKERLKTYILLGLACGLATLINPYGYELYYASWQTLAGEYSQTYISEWKAAKVTATPRIYVHLALLMVLAFYTRKKFPLADIILATFWVIMSASSTRHGVVSAIFLTPVIAVMLTDILSRHDRAMKIEKNVKRDLNQRRFFSGMYKIVLVVIAIYLIPFTRNMVTIDNMYNEEYLPVKEIEFLATHFPGSNVMNQYCYGSYIIYQARNNIKPFIDSRLDSLYPTEVKHDHFKMLFRSDWTDTPDKYNVNLAIFDNSEDDDNPHTELAFKAAGWEIVHKGEVATIYKRSDIQRRDAE